MSRANVEHYRRWFEYEKDAHAKVLRSLESVPAERRATQEFQRALAIFRHIAAARRIWLSRLDSAPTYTGSLFPEGGDIAQAASEIRDAEELWDAYLSRLSDDELGQMFEYKSIDGRRFRNPIEDTLTQLFGHSLYHRGQIAMLVRAAGGEPAATDFIYWCREEM